MTTYAREWLKKNPENFPVASALLPKAARAPILTFYNFARGADEIADSASIPAEERKHALIALDQALAHGTEDGVPEFALPFLRLAREHSPLAGFGRDLLKAFIQDTMKTRYQDYAELLNYCQYSAAPVGHVVLYACGETHADIPAADALCNTLQILNHLQDCGKDYLQIDRVYLPLNWMAEEGIDVTMLAASHTSPELRRVINRTLDGCDQLLDQSHRLIATLTHRRTRWEITFIYKLARRLSALLRVRDPLASRVKLSKAVILWCLISSLVIPAKAGISGK